MTSKAETKIPGSSYDNPIWYRDKWRIYVNHDCAYIPEVAYVYCHDDYDGAPDAGDNRCGHARTVQECKNQIDELDHNLDS